MPTDDEIERRSLHAAEIEMDRRLAEEESASRGEADVTQHYDTSSPVHAGRLAAAIHTLRLIGGTARRLLGRVGDLESAAGRQASRIVIVEGAVVLLFGALALVLVGAQAGATFAVLLALWLWFWP